jgi:hypothetical protein
MDWALIIHDSCEVAEVAAGIVADKLGLAPTCAANLADARQALRKHGIGSCKLIVSSLSPPLDAEVSSPVDRDYPTAVDFVNQVREGEAIPPCILIGSTVGTSRSEPLATLQNVELLGIRAMGTKLESVARQLLGNGAGNGNAIKTPLDVDIVLLGDGLGRWHIHNKEREIDNNGTIKINSKDFDDLLLFSGLIGDVPDARAPELISRLGRHFYDCLLGDQLNTGGLDKEISRYTDQLATLESARLRFHVNQATCPLFVETLSYPMNGGVPHNDLWMLRLPIFRKFGDRGGRPPLFKDQLSRETDVRCLIIEGDTGAFSTVGTVAKGFAALPEARQEIDWLSEWLTTNAANFGLAPPLVLRAREHEKGTFGAAVLKALRSERWQLVHYSGHSDIGADGVAYLVLGSASGDLLDIDTFAKEAADAQFIFLNSCNSANASFVLHLVDRNIPAVAGYAWPVPDGVAARFSKLFYESLFNGHGKASKGFIEYSFMNAKSGLYNAYKTGKAWTAPLLFMQTLDSQNEYRALA